MPDRVWQNFTNNWEPRNVSKEKESIFVVHVLVVSKEFCPCFERLTVRLNLRLQDFVHADVH